MRNCKKSKNKARVAKKEDVEDGSEETIQVPDVDWLANMSESIGLVSDQDITASNEHGIPDELLFDLDTFIDVNELIAEDEFIDRDVEYYPEGQIKRIVERYKGGYAFQEKIFDENGCIIQDIHEQDDTILVKI